MGTERDKKKLLGETEKRSHLGRDEHWSEALENCFGECGKAWTRN